MLAKKGKSSSISFIKHTLPEKPLVTNGKIQTIAIGGTNFRTVNDQVKNGESHIIKSYSGTIPKFETGKNLADFLNENLENNMAAIALNFAYPLSPFTNSNGLLDGILMNGTKEHAFKGLIGEKIGEFISTIYYKKFGRQIPVSVANDTVCMAISGNGNESGGLILGSGFNIGLRYQNTIINLEAGNFSKFADDSMLETIDELSDNRGINRFEKMLSGNYLPLIYKLTAKQLNIDTKEALKSEDLSILAQTDSRPPGDLARALLKRSSSLVATAIAAIYEFLDKPDKLILITEGSLFWKGWKYQENVLEQIEKLNIPKNSINFKHIPDSSIKGASGLLIK